MIVTAEFQAEAEAWKRAKLGRSDKSKDREGDFPICITDSDVNVLLARRGLIFCGWTIAGEMDVYPIN